MALNIKAFDVMILFSSTFASFVMWCSWGRSCSLKSLIFTCLILVQIIDPALAATSSYNNPRHSKRVSEPSTLRKDYHYYFVLAILQVEV
ncbi:hypothetical protein TorRG33x02_270680 [Trema orientale]|uniref:Transmembrane protein n=1 Tax=Trema orientale TaxID=63057 RepID=A0A2P5CWQ8_TREOI|nr:hypothetical protein TorRG33x02_270680 [Trema orientale]